jgi:uncharacterized membrane protein (TIGR02234 family)
VASSRPGRRELLLVLLTGAAGAGLVLLAMRHGWAHVSTAAPKPLPSSVATLTGQDLVPAASALAVAALAGLAAILATRRMLRRITGIVLVAFGIGIAAALSASISAADMLAAAAGSTGPAAGADAGAAAGSVTSGGGTQGAAGTPVAGFPGHATLTALPWRGVAFAGALLVIAAGILATWQAERMPVMSSRYDSPAGPATSEAPDRVVAPAPAGPGTPGTDSATIWESLSRGEDPTAEDRSRTPATGRPA